MNSPNYDVPNKMVLLLGAILGLFAVLIGAFGAHSVSQLVLPETMMAYETGVRYQFYHALALLALGILGTRCPDRWAAWTSGLFAAGTLCFSGSLYLITALKAAGMVIPIFVGLLTPLGGVLFIAGWITFCAAIIGMKTQNSPV